ncbi:Aste57867_10647 [Aphanomyces stellatus]|uniref:Aste57867_10647 protein n=1 Tax=Aphanomyces stellatus TaxID=120398 RepID=A0A485KQX0_9STRA|nr:hypothetical protein As57867_010607 [Aphanomyces stellatus]VFT87519.1 Aste57867_10647 [Aphanomyces stellatus]
MGRREVWSSYDDEEAAAPKKTAATDATGETVRPKKPFNVELLRNKLIFGGLVGATTGATFGFGTYYLAAVSSPHKICCPVGAFQTHHTKHGNVNSQAMLTAARTAGTTGGLFGAFFLAYQGLKTSLEQVRGEEDFLNAGAAAAVAGLPFYRNLAFRSHLGYAGILIALDYFHDELNQYRK